VRILRWASHTVLSTMWLLSWVSGGFAYATGGIVLGAVAFTHMEYRLFVIRRKVPVEQWPRRLWV
jgi:hypothetical protein